MSEETVQITLTVNGERRHAHGAGTPAPGRLPAHRPRASPGRTSAASTAYAVPVRCASTARVVRGCLMLAVQADGSRGRHHRRADRHGRDRRPAGGVCRPQRPAVRLLHARHADDGSRAAARAGPKSREEIRTFLSGNYCRCTGFHAIVDAVETTLEAARRDGAGRECPTRSSTPRSTGPTATSAAPCRAPAPSARWPAAAATPTTSRCRACCMPRSCAARSPTPRSSRSTSSEAKRQPGVALIMTGAELAKLCTGPWVGTLTCFPGMKSAPQYPHGRRPRLLGRRAGRHGRRPHPRRGRGRGRAHRGRMAGTAGRHRQEDRARSRHARLHPELGDNLAFRKTIDTGAVDAAFAKADLVIEDDLRVRPPHRRQPGAARAAGRLRQGHRQAHHHHQQPMPAHDPARVRAHAGRAPAQRADHRARCRRLVRPQDPHLRRRAGDDRRRHPARPPGQVHRRPPGIVRVRYSRARELRARAASP